MSGTELCDRCLLGIKNKHTQKIKQQQQQKNPPQVKSVFLMSTWESECRGKKFKHSM